MIDLASPYVSYAYAYPHKTAYRVFDPPLPLSDVWADEPTDSLFLYMHIPFCEMRCGFCNLFTTTNPDADFATLYLQSMQRHAAQTRDALTSPTIARMAVGGGTPTYLSVPELHCLFDIAEHTLGAPLGSIPISVETSPLTAQTDKLIALKQRGVTRISIGVQSFIEAEAHAAGRPQRTRDVLSALQRIRDVGFPTLNLDLIYGIANQTPASWIDSLTAALEWRPEEIYMYPLYVRPLTGLGKHPSAWDDQRLELYQIGRDFLLSQGYEQVSMRMFRLITAPTHDSDVYCCQEDGMIGLGCGARSYTRALHYSSEYGVARATVRDILARYLDRTDSDFAHVDYGFHLDPDDQRRRYVIKSVLRRDGLHLPAYRATFHSDPLSDLPILADLITSGFLIHDDDYLRPTPLGLQYSDAIGPTLYSDHVRTLSEAYELR